MASPSPDRLEAPARFVFSDPGLSYARVVRSGDEPGPLPDVVDVAVLDMHHGFPNLGHESIVDTLLELAREERLNQGPGAPGFRVVSFDVRLGLALPSEVSGRYPLVVGTGGPGGLDPRQNDGKTPWSQGVREDPSWEAPLFRLFERALADPAVSLLAICHTFGLLCRWSGFADAVLRTEAKGGKSMGAKQNVLTGEAARHPWFAAYHRVSHDGVVRVLDSRLFDLVPTGEGNGTALAFEEAAGGGPGEAVTMLELERDADHFGPRVWGVNHHPEIGDRGQQRTRLDRLAERGEVSPEWIEERRKALEAWNFAEAHERGLQWTSSYTFQGPLRRIVARLMAERRRPIRLVRPVR